MVCTYVDICVGKADGMGYVPVRARDEPGFHLAFLPNLSSPQDPTDCSPMGRRLKGARRLKL